jgi:hypothetical protein
MTCALCLKERVLRNSHIIPEFLYKSAYDHKHRAVQVERGNDRTKLLQKGLRQELLCGACEQLLNTKYECDISGTWTQLVPEKVTLGVVELEIPNALTFELFHLSILWRASQASGSEWAPVSLGTKHSEVLRTAIQNGRLPKGARYPIFATMLVEDEAPAMRWLGATSVGRHGRAHVYSTLYGGFMWHIVVASHSIVPPGNPYCLSPEGRLVVPVFPVSEIPKLNLRPLLRASRDALQRK